jgi:2'-5' RNA ligase
MPRLFVAADVPESQRTALLGLREYSLDARWTPPEQYHLTLQFLGDVAADRLQAVEDALATIRAPRFDMEGTGLGVFASIRNPRVLVAHLAGTPPLLALQQRVEAAMGSLDFPNDKRPFRPHITVARLKRVRPREMRAYLRTHADFRLAPVRIAEIHLYESVLTPAGAQHEKLRSYILTPG